MKFFSVVTTIVLATSVAVSLALGLATLSLGFPHPSTLVWLAAFALAAIAPRMALALALAALPFGGNRPATIHAFYSVIIGAGLLVGLTLNARRATSRPQNTEAHPFLSRPLLFAGAVYCFVSAASLISVPLNHLLDDARNIIDRGSLGAIGFSLLSIIRTNEHSLLYSYVAVFLTFLSYSVALHAFRLCSADDGRTSRLFLGAIGVGLLTSFALGILDYYSFIDLRPFRELDPIVNPGNRQFRLQSLFAHSGWYAEYVTLTIPTCLLLLTIRASFWVRASLIVGALALGEFVLILTYQRGGWLSYPLTLFAVWAAIYVVRLLERQEIDVVSALKKSVGKVVISLPLTIVASLLLVAAIQGRDSFEDTLSPYVSRFRDIQKTGDRTEFLFAGLLIGSRHPVLGGGSDSFAWQFEREFESPTGAFPGKYTLPLHGSAHNVFAQTFSGKGAVGLLSLLALPILLIGGCLSTIKDPRSSVSSKLVTLTGACFAAAFLVYGNVQEVFYVQSLQYLFFVMIAVVAAVTPHHARPTLRRILTSPALYMGILALHLIWEFVLPGPTRDFYRYERAFGCFATERTPSGTPYRWCSEHVRVALPVSTQTNAIQLVLEAGPVAQDITISAPALTPSTHSLAPGERREIAINVPSATPSLTTRTIRIDASRSFVPALLWGSTADTRRLAFKIIQTKTPNPAGG